MVTAGDGTPLGPTGEGGAGPGRGVDTGSGGGRPVVLLHADMDAFFASVEQRDRPELVGRPVVVGGLSDRGVVSAASYEARRFGVHSAMPTVTARRLCPRGVFLPADHRKYAAVSRRVFAIFGCFSPRVEGLSLDEAFLDLSGTERLQGPPAVVGRALREAVREETRLAVSVGIAPSKLVAKIASEEAKPDGLLEVSAGAVGEFLAPLSVARLWGVGPVTRERLARAGFLTVGDLTAANPARVEALLGSAGLRAQLLARGEDGRRVETERSPVSVSEETTMERDEEDWVRLGAIAQRQAGAVARRLRRAGLRARTVVLKLKYGERRGTGRYGYPTVTRRTTLARGSDDGALLGRAARALLEKLPRKPVRLVGVGATNLEERGPQQQTLLPGHGAGAADREELRRERLNRALDDIADRFGADAVAQPPVGESSFWKQ